jgi:DUF971 family protein
MRPKDIQPIGSDLAIKWDNGREDFIPFDRLRRCCPCASCQGEVDIMGNLYKGPDTPLAENATQLLGITNVGGYAIQPIWADQHATGIYSFDYLQKLASLEN